MYICDFENRIYADLEPEKRWTLDADMLKCVDRIEQQMSDSTRSERSDSMISDISTPYKLSMIQKREPVDKTGDFYILLHALQVLLTELKGGTMPMFDVLGITRPPVFSEFRIFL